MSANFKNHFLDFKLNFFEMKRTLLVILLVCPFVLFAQDFSKQDQNEIDRHNAIITNPNSPDTAIANSYLELSSLLYVSNIDTMIPL